MHQVTFAVQIVYCSKKTGKHRSQELFREPAPAVLVLECSDALPKGLVHETLMLAIGTFDLEAVEEGAKIFPSRVVGLDGV